MSLHALGLAEAAAGIREGRLSSAELVADCIKRIDKVDRDIEAWAFLDRGYAMQQAQDADDRRKQGKPTFDETITAEEEGKSGPGGLEFEKDDLYDEAARIVVSSGQVSISYLQRKLRIGFSRAARLVDMMEAEGLVSPGAGGKPREVLVDRGYFEEVDAQLR